MYKFVFNIGSKFFSSQFSSVTQQCLTLCDPMDCSMPGFPRPLPTPKICSNSCASSQWCHSTISSSAVPFSSCLQSFPASGSFQMSQLFTSGGASASASVLPLNFQGWFSLALTGLISLLSKGLSRLLSSTTVWKHQFFSAQPYGPALTLVHDYWKNHVKWKSLSHVQLFATPQPLQSMEFSRPEYWSG